MSVKIDLIRHGELVGERVYCGITDTKLSSHGWEQMNNACKKNQIWDVIVSSPLIRCSAFAQKLAKELSIPIRIDANWQEMNFGDWDGLSADEIMVFNKEELYQFWNNPLQNSPPNGETLNNMQARVLSAWNKIIDTNKNTLVISHGGPIRIINCHLEDHPIEKLLEIDVPYADRKTVLI